MHTSVIVKALNAITRNGLTIFIAANIEKVLGIEYWVLGIEYWVLEMSIGY